MVSKIFRLSLIQMKIGANKTENIKRAVTFIKEATQKGSELVVLPECFNSPYGTKYFSEYAEFIPSGETSEALSAVAKESKIFLVGGSIPEKYEGKYYNTCTVWGPDGQLITKHRKVHLFDIDIPGGITFKESDVLSPGRKLTTFDTGFCKVGLGVCYDMRFNEMATLYRKMGVDIILYPGAFNMKTGPLHWELLLRARAVDNQVYTAGVCGAQDVGSDYVAWGHTTLVNPWGDVVVKADFEETTLTSEIDITKLMDVREQIPTMKQRRTDLYDTVGFEEKK